MSNFTLGDYDFQDDDTNSRLTITSNSTNNKIHLNDSGTLELPNGNINLNGGDITNAGSVSTESLENNGTNVTVQDNLEYPISDGVTRQVADAPDNTGPSGRLDMQQTTNVSTGGKVIYTDVRGDAGGSVLLVTGHNNSTGDEFVELILVQGFGDTVLVIESSTHGGSTASRSYGSSGGELSLTMGADTYDVFAVSLTASAR